MINVNQPYTSPQLIPTSLKNIEAFSDLYVNVQPKTVTAEFLHQTRNPLRVHAEQPTANNTNRRGIWSLIGIWSRRASK